MWVPSLPGEKKKQENETKAGSHPPIRHYLLYAPFKRTLNSILHSNVEKPHTLNSLDVWTDAKILLNTTLSELLSCA